MDFAIVKATINQRRFFGSTFKVYGKLLKVRDFQLTTGKDGATELILTIAHGGFRFSIGEEKIKDGTGRVHTFEPTTVQLYATPLCTHCSEMESDPIHAKQ